MNLMTPVSAGELVDKISILAIKSERIQDPDKLANVRHELAALRAVQEANLVTGQALETLAAGLKQVNEALWDIEDQIRDCERQKDFGPRFIELARAVYLRNDHRADLKKQINLLTGSTFVEEKSYSGY
jgi:hypothetical protein